MNISKKYIKYDPYLLVLTNESATKKYEKVINPTRTENNYLRLFATELDFLNRCFKITDKKSILIYMSSSNDISHIYKIATLYPELEYHVYNLTLTKEESNIKIFNKTFDFEDIAKYQNADFDIYVISNFESIKADLEFTEKENLMKQDMKLQMDLLKKLNPNNGAYIKFRLPHFIENKENPTKDNLIIYFQGVVFKTIFSPVKTSECRLYVTDFNSTIEWNYKKIDEQMYYYNDIIRESILNNPIKNKTKITKDYHNYDFICFFWILKDYFTKRSYSFCTEDELIKLYKYINE